MHWQNQDLDHITLIPFMVLKPRDFSIKIIQFLNYSEWKKNCLLLEIHSTKTWYKCKESHILEELKKVILFYLKKNHLSG